MTYFAPIEQEEAEVTDVPAWIHGMKFCHIIRDETGTSYCGDNQDRPTCPPWEGEAICPHCGAVTCPRCAQLADLEDRLLTDKGEK